MRRIRHGLAFSHRARPHLCTLVDGSGEVYVQGLTYFTHEVDGRLYGGWYRRVADYGVEVYVRGSVRMARLGGVAADRRARLLLEKIVRGLAPQTVTE